MAAPIHIVFARSHTTNNTTYEAVGQIYWSSAEHVGVSSIIFRAVGLVSGGTGSAQLYNVTTNAVVATVEVSDTDYEMKEATGLSLTNENIYEIRIKSSDGAQTFTLGSAALLLA